MKAIILAAGRGSRLGKYTEHKPKCMLDIEGQTILERLIKLFRRNSIDDIVVVTGYCADTITYPGVKYYIDEHHNNNMVYSLFCAESELKGDVIISYADILFEDAVLHQLLNSPMIDDISLVVDTDWEDYYRIRFGDPYAASESLRVSAQGKILEIGERSPSPEAINGTHIGLMRLSARGSEYFKELYYQAKNVYWDKPWVRGRLFQKTDISDFLQALIEKGIDVHWLPIKRGWLEFDTVHDYESVLKWLNSGEISKYYRIK